MKVSTILTGNTLNYHITIKERLAAQASLTEAPNVEDCDAILVFCPISSRPGTDINAALQKIPADKPAILVVMHHTYDPHCTVPESRRYVTRGDTVTVDCLYHETEGLLRCPRNNEAVDTILKELNKQPNVQPSEHSSAQDQGLSEQSEEPANPDASVIDTRSSSRPRFSKCVIM